MLLDGRPSIQLYKFEVGNHLVQAFTSNHEALWKETQILWRNFTSIQVHHELTVIDQYQSGFATSSTIRIIDQCQTLGKTSFPALTRLARRLVGCVLHTMCVAMQPATQWAYLDTIPHQKPLWSIVQHHFSPFMSSWKISWLTNIVKRAIWP